MLRISDECTTVYTSYTIIIQIQQKFGCIYIIKQSYMHVLAKAQQQIVLLINH